MDCSLSAILAAEQDRPDVAERRAGWKVERLGLDPRRLVFIDDTWAKTNMTRLVEKVPHGHWKTTALVAAVGHDGMRCGMTLDRAMDGDHFVAFCQHILAPTLSHGDIVVMDNLSSHKVKGVRVAIASAGRGCCTS